MEISNKDAFKKIIAEAFIRAKNLETTFPVNLTELGGIIKNLYPDFSPRAYGYEKLRPLLEEFPDVIKLIKDDSVFPPRYYASDVVSSVFDLNPAVTSRSPTKSNIKTNKCYIPEKIQEFGQVISKKWFELAELALPENWGDPRELPLLRSYIRHTFTRLVFEKKVVCPDGGNFATFNTGLVDHRYQPIYALFTKNQNEGNLPWFLESFCVPGENFCGKKIVKIFNPLPEAAYYFNQPGDAIYDIKAGEPYIDWEHVIEENADRIPPSLLELTTRNFTVKSCTGMNEREIKQYSEELSEYLNKNPFVYRQLIDAFNRALDLALKKVRWNYKTAIPVYYPTFNKLTMLLPLCLLSEDKVDLALVVEKTESGNYLGHTIYPLAWAYSNARLIARPESDWLSLDKI